jgi:hypothetical protein
MIKSGRKFSLIKSGCCRQDGSTICSSASYQAVLPDSTATSETTDRLSLNADTLFFPSASCDARFHHQHFRAHKLRNDKNYKNCTFFIRHGVLVYFQISALFYSPMQLSSNVQVNKPCNKDEHFLEEIIT